MTYQRLCRLIINGEFNYYSKQFDIIVEPLRPTDQTSYQISVFKNNELLEQITVEAKSVTTETATEEDGVVTSSSLEAPDQLRDKVYLKKQELYFKYLVK